jgi:hypothetical protein
MTKIIQFVVLAVLLVTFPVLFLHSASEEQIPEPEPRAEKEQYPIDGASVGGALLIVISLSTGYGVKRIYDEGRGTQESIL